VPGQRDVEFIDRINFCQRPNQRAAALAMKARHFEFRRQRFEKPGEATAVNGDSRWRRVARLAGD